MRQQNSPAEDLSEEGQVELPLEVMSSPSVGCCGRDSRMRQPPPQRCTRILHPGRAPAAAYSFFPTCGVTLTT